LFWKEEVMKRRVCLAASRKLKWVLPLLALVLLSGVAQSADLLMIPEEHPGPPCYARIIRWVGYTDWAAVVFYRSPSDVPKNFRLGPYGYYSVHLDYDLMLPEAPQILMEGFGVWEDVTVPGAPPYQEVLRHVRGTPVPIWFVKNDELEKKGDVTVADLEKMKSLRKGLADFYLEELQPTDVATDSFLNIVASGVVVEGEGGAFFMQYVSANSPWELTQTTLRFQK
jgi:hypothetical protein